MSVSAARVQTNWQVHGQILQDVLLFFQTHTIIPEKLYIQGNGWVEAWFPSGSNEGIWYNLENQSEIELEKPLHKVTTPDNETLTVRFRILQQPSRWHQFRQWLS